MRMLVVNSPKPEFADVPQRFTADNAIGVLSKRYLHDVETTVRR